MKQICGDCLHHYASFCAAWNIRTLANTEVGSCLHYAPASDVVEVVRCKDCKHCDMVDENERWCLGWGSPARLVAPDSYCSHGTRKEGKG